MASSRIKRHPETLRPEEGRRERRAAETRMKIFRAAMELFARRGRERVTVEEITQAADVGKGTFFNYFESKDHVLGVLVEIQVGKIHDALSQIAGGQRSALFVLRRMILRIAEEPGRSPEMGRALLSTFLSSESVRAMIQGLLLEGRRATEQIVAYGQERGEIDSQLNPRKTAAFFMRTFMGTVLFWSLHGEPALASCVEDSFQNFWRAVAASDARAER
jgi:AcrR family transcriptional regulator